MAEAGRRMKAEEMFVPEVLMAARAMQTGLAVLEPALTKSPMKNKGTMVIGTVYGDLHDIGKNLVTILLKSTGLRIIDLGKNVPVDRFVEAVKENQADLLGMSCLLTTTMPSMANTILALKEVGLRDKVKVIVGGAPITQQYAKDIGADGYAPSAGAAIDVVLGLL
jgi:5-methyltetrahydrofolate--homocysteine methyltransferase